MDGWGSEEGAVERGEGGGGVTAMTKHRGAGWLSTAEAA